jgi:hypothetical protein
VLSVKFGNILKFDVACRRGCGVVLRSFCCCFRFAVHNFLGAVCWFLCLAFAWFLLLLLVVACGGVRHLSRFILHRLAIILKI